MACQKTSVLKTGKNLKRYDKTFCLRLVSKIWQIYTKYKQVYWTKYNRSQTNSVPYTAEKTSQISSQKPWKLSCFRLDIVRQKINFTYDFEFHLGKYELFTMYANNKRYFLFPALIR